MFYTRSVVYSPYLKKLHLTLNYSTVYVKRPNFFLNYALQSNTKFFQLWLREIFKQTERRQEHRNSIHTPVFCPLPCSPTHTFQSKHQHTHTFSLGYFKASLTTLLPLVKTLCFSKVFCTNCFKNLEMSQQLKTFNKSPKYKCKKSSALSVSIFKEKD